MSSTHIAKPTRSGGLSRYIPILSWLPTYNRGWLSADVIAGLTLWGLVVPEAMAYAGVAGLPPQAGLYTLLAALLVYALLGTSRHLVVQATSATAALLASSVMGVLVTQALVDEGATPDPALYQAYASAFVLVVGVVFLLAGVARLGFITQFLSKPVMDGFVTGLALFVAVGQLNKLFGVPKGEGNTVEKLVAIVRELPEANWVTFAVGASALALLFLLPRWNKKIPAGLVVLFGYIALSTVLGLNANYGVEVVGSLPQGLPKLTLPLVPLTAYLAMIAPAIGVLLVAYSEALGVAREFAEKHGYEVEPNQELNAHAVANLVSSLLRRHDRRGQHVGVGGERRRGRAVAGGEPGHVGHGGRDGAVPHAAVPESARSGAGGVDHPRGVAHHRLAQTPPRAPDLADGVLAGGDHVRRRDPH